MCDARLSQEEFLNFCGICFGRADMGARRQKCIYHELWAGRWREEALIDFSEAVQRREEEQERCGQNDKRTFVS